MARFPLASLASLALVALGATVAHASESDAAIQEACQQIPSVISDASGFLASSSGNQAQWDQDISHWLNSSSQTPMCVVEVGSPDDLAAVITVVGAVRAPFAVKAGGHTSNPGFSSTTGVHVSLARLNQVTLSGDKSLTEIGTGQTWLDVYQKLDGTGRNVVGGRTIGPGVGGFTAGGGYSWKTNQFGLTCDTVKAYHVVLPNGTITTATADAYPDLFFALKGGLNRFGIITSIEVSTHEQPQVWGGRVMYTNDSLLSPLLDATVEFLENNTDPRAQLITTLQALPGYGIIPVLLAYNDAPEQPATLDFLENLDGTTVVEDTTQVQSFASMVGKFTQDIVPNVRGVFDTVSTTSLTRGFMAAIANETEFWLDQLSLRNGSFVSYDVEPFTPYGEHATDSAYPHGGSPLPLNVAFAWASAEDDEFWLQAIHDSIAQLVSVAKAEGIWNDSFTKYPNYALFDSTPEQVYGAKNAARLAEIRDEIDPDRVMDLAGGFPL